MLFVLWAVVSSCVPPAHSITGAGHYSPPDGGQFDGGRLGNVSSFGVRRYAGDEHVSRRVLPHPRVARGPEEKDVVLSLSLCNTLLGVCVNKMDFRFNPLELVPLPTSLSIGSVSILLVLGECLGSR